jgi:pilus assembly protein Flp/PilA
MRQMLCWLRQLLARQEGQGLLEYGLVISLIAVVAAAAVGAMGSALQQLFLDICTAVGGGQCS